MWNFAQTPSRRLNIYGRNLFGFFSAFLKSFGAHYICVCLLRRGYGPCLSSMFIKCYICLSKQSGSSFIEGRVDKLNCYSSTNILRIVLRRKICWNKLFYLINTIRWQCVKISLLKFLSFTIYDLLGMSPGVSMNLMT